MKASTQLFPLTLCIYIFFCIGLSSCAGYRVNKETNPFKLYGVESVSIPIFINRTSLPSISGLMTKEIRLMLSQFPELKLSAREDQNSDAVLVGIVESPQYLRETIRTEGTRFISDEQSESIGSRPTFYLPTVGRVTVKLTLVLIKRPTQTELELLDSEFMPYLSRNPKVMFSEHISLSRSFSRSIESNLGPDDGGVVNATRNRKIVDRQFELMAHEAALQFKQVVLNAF